MPAYLLIESRDPFESIGPAHTYELAVQLRAGGHRVALYLVQNGVLPVRRECPRTALGEVVEARIEVLADDFSLRERGISQKALASGIKAAPIDFVVERMMAGWNVLWH
jgi:hypothetical protein